MGGKIKRTRDKNRFSLKKNHSKLLIDAVSIKKTIQVQIQLIKTCMVAVKPDKHYTAITY